MLTSLLHVLLSPLSTPPCSCRTANAPSSMSSPQAAAHTLSAPHAQDISTARSLLWCGSATVSAPASSPSSCHSHCVLVRCAGSLPGPTSPHIAALSSHWEHHQPLPASWPWPWARSGRCERKALAAHALSSSCTPVDRLPVCRRSSATHGHGPCSPAADGHGMRCAYQWQCLLRVAWLDSAAAAVHAGIFAQCSRAVSHTRWPSPRKAGGAPAVFSAR